MILIPSSCNLSMVLWGCYYGPELTRVPFTVIPYSSQNISSNKQKVPLSNPHFILNLGPFYIFKYASAFWYEFWIVFITLLWHPLLAISLQGHHVLFSRTPFGNSQTGNESPACVLPFFLPFGMSCECTPSWMRLIKDFGWSLKCCAIYLLELKKNTLLNVSDRLKGL